MIAPVDVNNIRIETQRLILRPWRQLDLEDLFDYASVDGVGEMAGWRHHETLEDSRRVLDMFIAERKVLALELKESGNVIGSLGLEEVSDPIDVPEGSRGREIGYVLSKDYWGQGLMTEAVSSVIHYCFKELKLDWLICAHFERNIQSRRVIEKCGFEYIKKIDYTMRMGTHEASQLYIRYNHIKLMTAPIDVTNLTIETDRLLLRPPTQEDLTDFHEIMSDSEIARTTGWDCSETLEDTKERLDRMISNKEEFSIVFKETGKMIGTFAVQVRNWAEYPIEKTLKGREFGFDLNRNFWGKGLMSEAVAAVSKYCFQTLNYDFLTCGYFSGNLRSARVIEKCGFKFLFEDNRILPSEQTFDILTYIRYNPAKEKKYV